MEDGFAGSVRFHSTTRTRTGECMVRERGCATGLVVVALLAAESCIPTLGFQGPRQYLPEQVTAAKVSEIWFKSSRTAGGRIHGKRLLDDKHDYRDVEVKSSD